ncbi:MAG: hypothetical protein SOT07_04470 [Paludibacteraceae bacterium]|nr:hypothetical protein [Paludibacteraceae bacterium]
MKVLSTIKRVELTRKYQRQDGTYANIFGVTLEAGDDTLFAETFMSKESQERRGVVQGAIGVANLHFDVRYWNDRNGEQHTQQNIRLNDFELANRNISPQSAQKSEGGMITHQEQESAAEGEKTGSAEVLEDNAPF